MPLKDPKRELRAKAADPRYCPICGHIGKRVATRREVTGIHRRRQCTDEQCRYRWTSIELDLDRVQAITRIEAGLNDILASANRKLESSSALAQILETLKTREE